MGDIEVVGAGRLELRGDQIQMVRKQETNEGRNVLMTPALMGESILDQRRVKLKENQDTGSIDEVAVLKVVETNKIREIYRAICESPEKPSEIESGGSKKLKMNGEIWKIFKK